MTGFINYYADNRRDSAFNAGVARILLGTVALWRLHTTLDWTLLAEWPAYVLTDNLFLFPSRGYLAFLPLEVALCTVFLILFTIGYRIPATGFLSALLLAHLFGILNVFNHLHASTFVSGLVVIILLFAFFRDADALSVDGARHRYKWSKSELHTRLQRTERPNRSLLVLKWTLVAFGAFFFLTGFSKLVRGPGHEWVRNLPVLIHHYQVSHIPPDATVRRTLGAVIYRNQWIGILAGVGTLVLEMGLLVAILWRKPITPVILALFGFLLTIVVTMDPFFFELFLIPLLFLPWDDLHRRLTRTERLDVVYDEQCRFCAWLLQPFETIDLGSDLTFYSRSDLPDEYADQETDYEKTVWTFDGAGCGHEGYDAVRRLLCHFTVLRPIGWLLNRRPVRLVGEPVYARFAGRES